MNNSEINNVIDFNNIFSLLELIIKFNKEFNLKPKTYAKMEDCFGMERTYGRYKAKGHLINRPDSNTIYSELSKSKFIPSGEVMRTQQVAFIFDKIKSTFTDTNNEEEKIVIEKLTGYVESKDDVNFYKELIIFLLLRESKGLTPHNIQGTDSLGALIIDEIKVIDESPIIIYGSLSKFLATKADIHINYSGTKVVLDFDLRLRSDEPIKVCLLLSGQKGPRIATKELSGPINEIIHKTIKWTAIPEGRYKIGFFFNEYQNSRTEIDGKFYITD